MLDKVWIIPALPALGFLLTLCFGKRLGPSRAHFIGIPIVGVAFVLALVTAGQWMARDGALDERGAVSDIQQSCSREATTISSGGAAAGDGTANEGSTAEGGTGGDVVSAAPEATRAAESGGGTEELTRPVIRCLSWWHSGPLQFDIGTQLDGMAVLLLVVVTTISLLVHVYSSDYVNGDRRYTHYFAFLSLFTASMLFFVLAENTLQMMVGWELVGVCSFALIGHWWEEKPNSDAALKAFLTNRVGDVGLMIGVIVLFFAAGQNFSIYDINVMANNGRINHTLLLVSSCCLIAAVMSKSGQFILHTWLPDAMAGPTPVSALIHAATMVVAGIYMVGRLYPVFFHGLSIAGSSINLLAVVGSVTAVFGALLAFVQKDIKKVLAYSTVSQLGFMVTALGVGAWTAALFHLFTHAFFKAGLFLGAGSLSHSCGHSFDMVEDMGGMRKVMPRTFWTFVVGTLSLAGIFPLAGFWSKDEILAGTGGLGNAATGSYYFAFIMLLVAAAFTAAYMTRTIWYAFYGEYRGHGHPHENGSRITVPLVILAVLGAIAGFANLPGVLTFEHLVEPVGAYFPGHEQGLVHADFNLAVAILSTLAAVGGGLFSYLYYFRRSFKPLEGFSGRNRVAHAGKTLLENKYYLDKLYTDIIVGSIKKPIAAAAYWVNQHVIDGVVNGAGKGAVVAGKFVYEKVDQLLVDGAVNGVGSVAESSGGELRRFQTGHVQQYAALFFAAAALLCGVFVLILG